ncbi:MAG: hypothetical protein ACK5UX_02950, partial [Burkholderiales bacterium]
HDHTTLTGCTMSRLFSGTRALALCLTTFAALFATLLPQIGFAETPRVTAATLGSPAASQAAVRAVEFTYLKSQPGERDNLRQAIVANWLAMDAIAVQQGLMVDYKVFDAGNDDGEWNIKVMVVYPDARGYDGVREAFEKIRAAHKPVLINGKSVRDLGRVVRSQRVMERPAESHAATPATRL